MTRGGREERYRESVEIQAKDKVVDDVRPPAVAVDAVEDVARRFRRQCRDFWTLAVVGNGGNTGSDAEGHGCELTQLVHHGVDLLGVGPLGVEDGLGVIEDYEHLLGDKEGSQGGETLGVFEPCTDDLRKAGEEMSTRGWELVTTDEPTIVAEPCLDATIVENREGDRRFPDPSCTNESDGFQVFGEANNVLDQLIAPETGPWRRWGKFSKGDAI